MNHRSWITLFVIVFLIIASGLAVSYFSFSTLIFLGSLFILLFLLLKTEKALLFLIAYIPFQLALNLAPGIDIASARVLILILFGLWILKSLAKKRLKISSNPATYLVLVILALSILSLSQGVSLERSLRKVLVFASCFPVYFLVTGIFSAEAKPRVSRGLASVNRAVKVLVLSSLGLAIIGLIQFFSQFFLGIKPVYQFWARFIAPIFLGKTFTAAILANPSWLVNVGGKTFLRATSLFPDPHIFSFFLGLVIPLAFGFLFCCKKHKGLLIVSLCLLLATQLLTFSRGGYLGLFVALPLVILLLWGTFTLKTKVFGVVFILVSLVMVLTLGAPITGRIGSIFNFKEPSNFGRLLIWRQALDIFRDHPLLGVGIGGYSEFVDPTASYRAPIYAHNTYLDIAVEMGIFALIAWLGIFLVALKGLWRTLKKKELRIISAGLIGSLVWFSVHCLVDTPIFSPRILPILMVILGLSVIVIKSVEK